MKKVIVMLLSAVMAMSLVGCGMLDDLKEQALSGIQDAVNEAKKSLDSEITGFLEDKTNKLADSLSEEAVGSVLGHDPLYFCDLYGQNRCPFSISVLGISFDYYFRNGGELYNWVYSEENTGGWYIYDGHIISADNGFAIKIDGADSFSSCCTYEAKPYTGKTLSKEEQAAQTAGFFHTINSYTPVDTNFGIMIYRDSERPEAKLIEKDKFTCYGLVDTLKDQEWFCMCIISGWNNDVNEAVKLWAMEHRDYSKYPEYLSENELEKAVCLGSFSRDSESKTSYIDAYIPNKEAGGFAAGQIDLVLTYGDNNYLVVGAATVNTLSDNESVVTSDVSKDVYSGNSDVSSSANTSAPLVFRGYTEVADWPDATAWASLGLPNLTISENVNGSVHISDKNWIYPLNGSDGVMIEVSAKSSHIEELMGILKDSGICPDEGAEYSDGCYSINYQNNGNKMKIKLVEKELDVNYYKVQITVITNPTE